MLIDSNSFGGVILLVRIRPGSIWCVKTKSGQTALSQYFVRFLSVVCSSHSLVFNRN